MEWRKWGGEIAIEDLIANEGVIVTLTHSGLIKRTNVSSYRAQRRGGKGVIGMTTREGPTEAENDFIEPHVDRSFARGWDQGLARQFTRQHLIENHAE